MKPRYRTILSCDISAERQFLCSKAFGNIAEEQFLRSEASGDVTKG